MMRARLVLLFLVVAVVCFSTTPARAQGIRVYVMGSGSFLENSHVFSNPFGEQFGSNYASGGKVTLGAEIPLVKFLEFEGSYGIGRNNLRVTDLSSSQTLGYGVRTQRWSGNVVVRSPASFLSVRPYATGGLEYDHLGTTGQAKSLAFTEGFADQTVKLGASNQVGFNYGAGADWGFFPALALRLDLRDHVTGTPTYGLSSHQFAVSGAAHNVELSVGLVLHIGK
jgi:opacity protein-like surface antigen